MVGHCNKISLNVSKFKCIIFDHGLCPFISNDYINNHVLNSVIFNKNQGIYLIVKIVFTFIMKKFNVKIMSFKLVGFIFWITYIIILPFVIPTDLAVWHVNIQIKQTQVI